MQVQYIKAAFQEAAYNLSNKIKSVPQANKESYIVDRLYSANEKIRDTFTGEKASKIFKQVEAKASKDWTSMHKIQNFVLKNSNKISKGAIIGGIAVVSALVLGTAAKVVNFVKSKN